MTFQLSSFKARSIAYQNVTEKRGIQELIFKISAANTDATLDLSTIASTFWTAAIADSTYGAMATAVLTALENVITPQASDLYLADAEALIPYVKVLTLSAGNQYTASVGSYVAGTSMAHLPVLTFNSGNAPTALVLRLHMQMLNGQFPLTLSYN